MTRSAKNSHHVDYGRPNIASIHNPRPIIIPGLSEGMDCVQEGPYFDIYHIIVCPPVKVHTFEVLEGGG